MCAIFLYISKKYSNFARFIGTKIKIDIKNNNRI